MTDTALIEAICKGIDAELAEIASAMARAKETAGFAWAAFERGDLLESAKQVHVACDLEYGALGDCDYCGQLSEQIQRAHVGNDTADRCSMADCAICRELNAEVDS